MSKPGQRAAGKQGSTPVALSHSVLTTAEAVSWGVNHEPLGSTVLAVSREGQKRHPAGNGLSVVWFF